MLLLTCNLYLVLHPDLCVRPLTSIFLIISISILLVNCWETEMELHLEYSGSYWFGGLVLRFQDRISYNLPFAS